MDRSDALPPFQHLLDAHAGLVLGFLRAAVGPADADDCFQETFIAALRAYPDLEHGRELRAWLLAIARRKAVDHHRAASRRPRPVAQAPEPAVTNGRAAGGAVDDRGVAGSVAETEDAAALWALVAELPEGQRSALALRYAGGLPYSEVAAALDCSPEAARRRVSDGLRSLRMRSRELEELVA